MITMAETKSPSGIGGWLILPMLGLIITPIRLAIVLLTIHVPIFTEGTWGALTTPGNPAYHQLWAPLLMYEVVGNVLFVAASIILLVMLFTKHHLFPKWMIIFYISNLAFVGIDFFAGDLIPVVAAATDMESVKELIRSVIGVAIWVPYFIKSRRVRNTFSKEVVEQAPSVDPMASQSSAG